MNNGFRGEKMQRGMLLTWNPRLQIYSSLFCLSTNSHICRRLQWGSGDLCTKPAEQADSHVYSGHNDKVSLNSGVMGALIWTRIPNVKPSLNVWLFNQGRHRSTELAFKTSLLLYLCLTFVSDVIYIWSICFCRQGYNLSPFQHNANAAGKAVALLWIVSLLGLQTDLQFGPSLARWQIKLTSLLMLRSLVSFHLCNLMKDSSTLSEIRQRVQKSWQCQAAWELRDETTNLVFCISSIWFGQ